MNYNIKTDFLQKYEDVENCVKIPNSCKKKIKQCNYKKLNLRKKDSIHSHKTMRKENKDWKDFNQM